MPRSKQLLYVAFRSYFSSWMTWLVVAIVLVGDFLVALNQSSNWNEVIPFEINGGHWKQQNIPHDRTQVDRLTIHVAEILSSTKDDLTQRRFWSHFPRLKHLVIDGSLPLEEPQLMEVLRTLELESLSIRHLGTTSTMGWDALAHQPLKRLRIHSLNRTDVTAVRLPITLESLDMPYSSITIHGQSDRSHMSILRGHPHLTTIVLQSFITPASGLRDTDREILQSLPSLRRVYVEPQFAGSVQHELPHLTVRPTRYESNRTSKSIALLAIGMIPLFSILHVLSLQFARKSSIVIPRYHVYHFGAAALLFTMLWMTQFVAFSWNGFHASAALAMAGAILIPVYVFTEVISRTSRFPGYINAPSLCLAAFPIVAISGPIILSNRAEADWVFQGQRLDIVMLLIGLELISLVGFFRFFAGLARRLTEMAAGSVPFDMWNNAAWQQWMSQTQAQSSESWLVRLASIGPESRLQAALRCPRQSPHFASRLWRAGTAMSAFGFAGASIAAMIVVTYLMNLLLRGTMPGITGFMSAQQTILMSVMAPWLIMMQWRPHLARHLLMSLGRRDWVHLVFRETAFDFLPTTGIGVIALCIYACNAPSHWWPVQDVALVGLASLGVTYATLLIVATNPRFSGFVFFIAIVGFMAFVVLSLLSLYAIVLAFGESALEPWLNYPPIFWGPLCIIAVATITLAYRRWMTWELGLIGR